MADARKLEDGEKLKIKTSFTTLDKLKPGEIVYGSTRLDPDHGFSAARLKELITEARRAFEKLVLDDPKGSKELGEAELRRRVYESREEFRVLAKENNMGRVMANVCSVKMPPAVFEEIMTGLDIRELKENKVITEKEMDVMYVMARAGAFGKADFGPGKYDKAIIIMREYMAKRESERTKTQQKVNKKLRKGHVPKHTHVPSEPTAGTTSPSLTPEQAMQLLDDDTA